MNLAKRKIWIILGFVSGINLILLSIFYPYLINSLFDFLLWIQKPLSSLTHSKGDILILSCIPIWTYPLYFKDKSITLKKMIRVNLIALFTLTLSCISAFILIDLFVEPISPWLPEMIVYSPFPYFQTVTLLIGVLLTYIIFIFFRWFRKNKSSDLFDEADSNHNS